jgi:hypothetical protein
MKTAKDGKFPVIVSEGGVSAKIRKITQTKNGTEYITYIVDYVLLGKRKQVGRTDFEEARHVALNACRQIANGHQVSLTLTNDDRLKYLRAVEPLKAIGVELDVAALEYVAATRNLPGGATLRDAVDFYRRRHATTLETRTVRQVVDEMLVAKRSAKLSDVHIEDLEYRLNRRKAPCRTPMPGWIDNTLLDFHSS